MLPEHGDQDEYRGDEDDGQSDLGYRSRWEGLDFSLASGGVVFLVPSWEGCEEEEADECKHYCDDAVEFVSRERCRDVEDSKHTHIRYGNTIISLN